jgi:predicted RNase H-like HicB family nuclease
MKTSVTFHASLPIKIKKKNKYYVSCCHVLDVWSQGETKMKATENLREALQLFLIDCFERGTLDKVLKESGFTSSKPI